MLPRGVFVFFFVFVGQHECFQTDENSNKLSDAEWQCDSVCVGSGGIAELDLKNKICKCTLDKNMDDAEKELFIKNALAMGVHLVFDEGFKPGCVKREVDALDQSDQNIVGQRAPNRLVTPRTRPSMNFPSTTRRSTTRRPITPIRRTTPRRNMDMQQRLQQFQKRMNDRRRSRARSRGGLLQQRAGFESDPHQDLMERVRKMQRERQEKRKNKPNAPTSAAPSVAAAAPPKAVGAGNSETSPVIGASHNAVSAANHKSTKEESGAAEKTHLFELITQDPSLYKDDNKL